MEFIVFGTAPGLVQASMDDFGSMPLIVMVVAIVGFAVFMVFSVRGKITRRNASQPSARELVERMRSRPRAVAGHDTQHLAAELHETARRLSAQMDNKARRLEKLIEDADQRIAALGGGTQAAAPGPGAAPAAAPAQSNGGRHLDALTREVYEQADAGRTAVEIAQRLDEQVGKIELILALRG